LADGNLAREVDRADQEIDAFISRRETYLDNEAANERAKEWSKSERRYRASRRLDLLAQWSDYFLRQAEIHERIADESREKAARLFSETGRR